jgi:hypothetical protein
LPPGCAILLGFFLGASLYNDDFLIANRVLPYTWHNHQTTTSGTKFGHRFLPDGEVAGRVVAAPIEDTFLLLRLAFYQVAPTYRT